MVESFINEGKQSISNTLQYGISITDCCLGWNNTEKYLDLLNNLIP